MTPDRDRNGMTWLRSFFLLTLTLIIAGCVSSHLGGTISGLTANGLVLVNGKDSVSPQANATTFAFPTLIPQGASYNVLIQTQPDGLECSVANGAGTMGATQINNVEVTCAPSPKPYVISDTFDSLNREGGFLSTASRINGSEIASLVHVPKPSIVTKIAWSGHINTSSLANGKADFLVRIYKAESGQPSAEKVYEAIIAAEATKAQTTFDGFYTFSYISSNIVTLVPDDYFIAILDPETQNLNFSWEIEKDHLSSINGTGGAFRSSPGGAWQALNDGMTIYTGRGYSLLVEGVSLDPLN